MPFFATVVNDELDNHVWHGLLDKEKQSISLKLRNDMYLTKAEVSRFKKRLEEMRDKLTSSLQLSTAEVKKPDESTGYSQHQADQGTDDFDRKVSLELASQEFQMLRLIERALEKVQEGTYGICDISGEEIPKARLEAMPHAATTVKSQEKLERGLL